MKQHQYQITVQHLADAQGHPSSYDKPISFQVGNHDDIFAIIERLKQANLFDEQTSTAFAVGLKLFSEVMLENKNHPLFAEFQPAFVQFMKHLKQYAKQKAES